jgi:hypothetical protein
MKRLRGVKYSKGIGGMHRLQGVKYSKRVKEECKGFRE